MGRCKIITPESNLGTVSLKYTGNFHCIPIPPFIRTTIISCNLLDVVIIYSASIQASENKKYGYLENIFR